MPLNNPNDPGYGTYLTSEGGVSTAFPERYSGPGGRGRAIYTGSGGASSPDPSLIRGRQEARLKKEFEDVTKAEHQLSFKYQRYMTPEGFAVYYRGTKKVDPHATKQKYIEYHKDYTAYQKEYQEASTMWGDLASRYNYQSFDPIEKFKADNPPEMRAAAPGGRIRQKFESYSVGGQMINQPLSLRAGKFEKYGQAQALVGIGVGVGTSLGLVAYDIGQFAYQFGTHPIKTTKSFFKLETYKHMWKGIQEDPVRGIGGIFIGGKIMGKGQKAISKRVYTGTEYKLFETSPIKYKEKTRTSSYVQSTAKSGFRIEATKYQYFDFRTKFGGKLLKYELKDYGKAPAVSKKYTDVGSRIDLEISSKGEIGGIFKQTPYLKDVTRPKRQLHQVGGDIRSISGKGDIRAFVETRSRYVGKGGKDVFRRKGTESIVNMEKISKYTEYAPYQKPFKGTYYEVTSQTAQVKYDPASSIKLDVGSRISQPPKKIVVQEPSKKITPDKRKIIEKQFYDKDIGSYKIKYNLDEFTPEVPKKDMKVIQEGKSGLEQIYGSEQILSPKTVETTTKGVLETVKPQIKVPKNIRSSITTTQSPKPISTQYQEYGLLQGGGLSPQIKQQTKIGIMSSFRLQPQHKLKTSPQLKTKGKTKAKLSLGLKTSPILGTMSKIKSKQDFKFKQMFRQKQQLKSKQMQRLQMKSMGLGIGIGFPGITPKIPKPKKLKIPIGTGLKKQSKRVKDKLGRGKHIRTSRYAPSLTGLALRIKQPKKTGKFTGLEIRGI